MSRSTSRCASCSEIGRRIVAVGALAGLAAPPALQAQDVRLAGSVLVADSTPDPLDPWWTATVSSLALPGSGQLLQGQERGLAYLFVEGVLLARVLADRAEGREERNRYVDLAFGVARAPFTPTVRDTAFQYFEQVAEFVESGPLDTDPGPDLVPPTDPASFNGAQWALALATFFPDPTAPIDVTSPEYAEALAFYRRRAVGPNFQWSWRNAGLEQDLYRRAIKESDDAFRRATQELGLILANHLVSALDTFITRRLAGNGGSIRLRSGVLAGQRARSLRGLVTVGVAF